MAKRIDPNLIEILQKYGERAEDALWDCHGTWVAYHKAIERIAAKAGIVFDAPQIVEADAKAKIATIVVRGSMGERSEWSFGEAAPTNNKNAYPFAMAEKRAKDRVVLKLVGLHGFVYSEEESDDFKPLSSNAMKKNVDENGMDPWARAMKDLDDDLRDVHTTVALTALWRAYAMRVKEERWPDNWIDNLKERFAEEGDTIKKSEAIAAG